MGRRIHSRLAIDTGWRLDLFWLLVPFNEIPNLGLFMNHSASAIAPSSSLSIELEKQYLTDLKVRIHSALAALEGMVQKRLPAHLLHRLATIGTGPGAMPLHFTRRQNAGLALVSECYELGVDIQGAMGEDYLQEFNRWDNDLKAACRQWAQTASGLSDEAFSQFLQTTRLPGQYLVETAGANKTRVMLIVKHLVKTAPLIAPEVLQNSEVQQACRQWSLELVANHLAPSGDWHGFLAQALAPEFLLALVALSPNASKTPAPPELRDYLASHAQVADRVRALIGPLAGMLNVLNPLSSLSGGGGQSILAVIAASHPAKPALAASMS